MKIMVFDVPAESGGALSVLNDFYNEYKTHINNQYIFVVSKPDLQETRNIKVLRFPWTKKSWLHRICFDHLVAPNIIKKYKVDEVLSLQNVIIPHTKAKQTVFIHNALPFSEYRFSIFEDKLLWVYQNILSRSFFKSIKKANRVIVQTEWMKRKCVDKLKIDGSKIEILLPILDIDVKNFFVDNKESRSTFFYPASGMIFKNHTIIIDACIDLKEIGIKDYKIIFTLNGNENEHIAKLFKIVEKEGLPIKFIGSLSREKVYEYYTKSVLIFPSYIETVGLPLLEARVHISPILASNCSFSREILSGYEDTKYFNPNNSRELFELMRELLNI